MLTVDLVRARVRKGVVEPQYIDPTKDELQQLATSLIALFDAHQGKTRGELQHELRELQGTGTEFLFHRALAKLLMDRCEFDIDAGVDPIELRQKVFELAAAAHTESSLAGFSRNEILQTASAQLDIERDTAERLLYADLKEEQLLTKFRRCSGDWLLDRYNLALAQAVLLRANWLEVEIPPQKPTLYRQLFQRVKFCQLLHEIHGTSKKGYTLRLDGPLSLFKSSQKYGVQIAMFLPALLHLEGWKLEAEVAWGKSRELRDFRLDAKRGLRPSSKAVGQWQPEEIGWLQTQFEKLESPWTISPGSDILDLGGEGVLIPDFVFTHAESARQVHLELFGFWRRGGLERRLELLRQHGPDNLIVGIGKGLHVEEESFDELPGEVYVYRTTPVARELRKLLRAYEA